MNPTSRRDVLKGAGVAGIGAVMAAPAATAGTTPVARLAQDYWAASAEVLRFEAQFGDNIPDNRWPEFDVLCERPREICKHLMGLPAESVEDIALKARVMRDETDGFDERFLRALHIDKFMSDIERFAGQVPL